MTGALRWLLRLLLAVGLLAAAALGYLLLSWQQALDGDRAFSRAAAQLPDFAGKDGIVSVSANGLAFRARIAGFEKHPDAPAVLLLHGFPVSSAMWLPLIEPLADAGYRVIAPDQRGYSPGARPASRNDYATDLLVQDAISIADAVGLDQFHLAGHDWGAMVGWQVVRLHPQRVLSWTALSIPHPLAVADALESDPEQADRIRYMQWMRMPWLPEALMARNDFSAIRRLGDSAGPAQVDEYVALLAEPGAATAAVNWYRAMPEDLGTLPGTDTIPVPTLFIHGARERLFGDAALQAQASYIMGAYRVEVLDAGHRVANQQPEAVAALLVEHWRTTD